MASSERTLARVREYCRTWRLANPTYQVEWRKRWKLWRDEMKRQGQSINGGTIHTQPKKEEE